jgi:hypothetical protein
MVSIFGAINDAITAALAPAKPPIFAFGDTTRANQAPPRIIYVPRSERITGPEGQGGDGVLNPRPLWTRHVGMEIHFWGADFAATEMLLNVFTQSVHDLLWGAYAMQSGTWDVAPDTINKLGIVYILQMMWKIPITRAPDTTAVVTAMPITQAIQPLVATP